MNSKQESAPFIVGVGRSGTTLLRLMLDAHPLIAIPWETHFLGRLLNQLDNNETSAESFLETVVNHQGWPDFHLDKSVFRKRVLSIEPFSLPAGLRMFYRMYAEKRGKPMWGDKTPAHASRIRAISELLPEARFIHLIRDGRDVAMSYKKTWFGPGDDIRKQAQSWVSKIQSCRRQASSVSHYIEVKYEDLVSDADSELVKICDFLDVPFDSRMMNYHLTAEERMSELETRNSPFKNEVSRQDDRLSLFELTFKPPTTQRIGVWQTDMSADDIAAFESVASEMLDALGYGSGSLQP